MTFRSSIPGFLCAFFGPSMRTCATCLILLLLYPSFVELKKTKQNNKLEELQEDLKSLKETSTGWYKVGLSPTWFSFRDFMWSTRLCLQLVILVLMLVSQECVRSPIVLLVPPSVAAFCGHETYPWCRSDAEEQPLTCLFFLSFTWWIPTYSNWDRTKWHVQPHGRILLLRHPANTLSLSFLTSFTKLDCSKDVLSPFCVHHRPSFSPHKLHVSCCPDPPSAAAPLVRFSSAVCRIFHLCPVPLPQQHTLDILQGHTCIW